MNGYSGANSEVPYRIKNWKKFQHFKDRKPIWIKVYRELLDDPDWHELDGEAAKMLVMLWLIASETNGELPESKKISFRLRISESKLNSLFLKISHWLEQFDIDPISERYPVDALETEKRREEKEAEKKRAQEILEFLNLKAGKHFKPTEPNLEPIVARLREGASDDDCRAVIANRVRKWAGSEEMREYLRPETVFGKKKFAQYQGELAAPETA